jgi:hypothetical protein
VTFVDYCGYSPFSGFASATYTPPAAFLYYLLTLHTHTPTSANHTQDRSQVPLEAPLIPVTSRFHAAHTQPCRNASKTTAAPHYHQTAAREHVSTLPQKHHVKCEKRLPAGPPVQKQTHCLRAAAPPRPPNSLSSLSLHTNTAHRKAPLLLLQTARCLALRALRSASIRMAR